MRRRREGRMSETREFDLGDILTIIDGRLISPRHMAGVYDILNFMTGEDVFTHQIPRLMREAKPILLRAHPQLDSPEINFAFGELIRCQSLLSTFTPTASSSLPSNRRSHRVMSSDLSRFPLSPPNRSRHWGAGDAELVPSPAGIPESDPLPGSGAGEVE